MVSVTRPDGQRVHARPSPLEYVLSGHGAHAAPTA